MGSRPTSGRLGHNGTYKTKRDQDQVEKLRVITAAESLEYYSYIKCRNVKVFPKKDRGCLPTRIMNEASDILADVMDANDYDLRDLTEQELRIARQRDAMRKCRLILRHIKLAYDLHCIDARVFAYWTELAESVKRQAAAWHKTDKGRLRDSRR